MLDLSHAYLCVRDLDDEGCPVLPNDWTCTVQDNDWLSLIRQSDKKTIAAWKANEAGQRGLFALFGDKEFLDAIAQNEPMCMPAREAWRRRAEASIRAYLRYWPTWRFDGHIRDGSDIVAVSNHVMRIVPKGVRIPDPAITSLPWLLKSDGSIAETQSEAAIRVSAIHRPSLDATLAGFNLHEKLENEPDLGA